jgi:hypothetical protein
MGFRPIGYSWFLSWVYTLSPSVFMIFIVQYLLYMISGLYLIFTLKYHFRPNSRVLFLAFSLLIILSPAAIYLSNTLLSDSLFISLTMLWLSSGIWLMRKIRAFTLIMHLVFLVLAMNTRYIGLFYPFISMGMIFFSSSALRLRLSLIILPLIALIFSIRYTSNEIEKIYLVRTFSPFSGWALANNAVSIIPHSSIPASEFDDSGVQQIHQMVLQYPDTTYSTGNIMATNFIWENDFPGKQIMFEYARNTRHNYYVAWVHMGIKYREYGKSLIQKRPVSFFRHYIIPNTGKAFSYYAIPGPDGLHPDKQLRERYNLVKDEYEYLYNPATFMNYSRKIFHHVTWISVFLSFLLLAFPSFRKNFSNQQVKILVFILIFIVCYLLISILMHPVNNYRYMMPLYALKIFVPYAIINYLLQVRFAIAQKKQPAVNGLLKRN